MFVRNRLLGVIAGFLSAVLMGCLGETTVWVNGCKLYEDPPPNPFFGWVHADVALYSWNVSSPPECPIKFKAQGGLPMYFSGELLGTTWIIAENETSDPQLHSQARTSVFDGNGANVTWGGQDLEHFFLVNGRREAYPSVVYNAGTLPDAYFAGTGLLPGDVGIIIIRQTNILTTALTSGLADLTYTHAAQSVVRAPSYAWAYVPENIWSTVSNVEDPVSYEWYVNDQFSGWTESAMSFEASPGTYTIRLDAWDYDGDRGSTSVTLDVLDWGGCESAPMGDTGPPRRIRPEGFRVAAPTPDLEKQARRPRTEVRDDPQPIPGC